MATKTWGSGLRISTRGNSDCFFHNLAQLMPKANPSTTSPKAATSWHGLWRKLAGMSSAVTLESNAAANPLLN